MMQQSNRTRLFLSLTFLVSYGLAAGYWLSGREYQGTPGTVLAIVYMFIPASAALFVAKVVYKENVRDKFLISFRVNWWFVAGWLLPLVLVFLTLGISLLFSGVSFSPGMEGMIERFEEQLSLNPEQVGEIRRSLEQLPVHPVWLTVLQGLFAGATINAVAGLGEELGWRGFLLDAFKEKTFLQASAIIGLIWGIWHAPLVLMGHNYPQHPEAGVVMMTVWCLLLSPLFLYVTIKSGSVIAAAIMHGTLNALAGIAIMVIDGGNDLLVGVTGLAGFIALILLLATLWIYDQTISREEVMTSKVRISWYRLYG